MPTYTTLDDWIAHKAIPFSLDSTAALKLAVDQMMVSLGDSVELLGLGEALHGGEEILILRNCLFQRLVEAHGYSAIAVESSFPRGHLVNEYVTGGEVSPEMVWETGFSHRFGQLEANRELVAWMRQYNTDSTHGVKVHFYGFDTPTEMYGNDSPRQMLNFVLDYFASVDSTRAGEYRQRIDALLGEDAVWEDPMAAYDPTKAVGLSPSATSLRIETEELATELWVRRPELVAKGDERRFLEALHYASAARQLLNYHAAMARKSSPAVLLGLRDASMADNLAYIVSQELGKVLAFAHNSHIKCGKAEWLWGTELNSWWPAGAHLRSILGPRYAAIGSAIGVSDANGIGQPEAGTLEERLMAAPGPGRFIPTHKGKGLPSSTIAALPVRSGSTKNPGYFPLTAGSLTDFDWLAVLDSTTYTRGWPPLP